MKINWGVWGTVVLSLIFGCESENADSKADTEADAVTELPDETLDEGETDTEGNESNTRLTDNTHPDDDTNPKDDPDSDNDTHLEADTNPDDETHLDSNNEVALGERLVSGEEEGAGPCAGVDLDSVIQKIHDDNPELSDIEDIFDPSLELDGDGSFIYAYRAQDKGFDIVLKRGQGDCPSGCIDNEYWYFETDESCYPVEVGHYHPTNGAEGCIEQDGKPMWGQPPNPDPALVCGEDQSAQDISGEYRFKATGLISPCLTSKEYKEYKDSKDSDDTSITVSISITQDKDVLENGTVIVSGIGNPLIDNRPLTASFARRRFSAIEEEDNLPSKCPSEHHLSVSFDFEGFEDGQIRLQEIDTPDCDNAPNDYCKGAINLSIELLEQ